MPQRQRRTTSPNGKHGPPPARNHRTDPNATTFQALSEELTATTEQLYDALAAVDSERGRYQNLFDLAPDGYFVTDTFGRILEANEAAISLLNLQNARIVLKPLFLFIYPPDRRRYSMALVDLKSADRWQGTLRLVPHGADHPFDADITIGATTTPYRTRRQLRWIVRDVTRQRRAEREVAAQRQQLQSLAAELSMAEERERRRIAAGIHDRVSQNLAAARMTVALLRSQLPDPDHKAVAADVCSLLDQTIEETRSLTFELSPPILHQLGLRAAIDWLAESVHRRHNLPVEVHGAAEGLSDEVRGLAYQATLELLVNVVKHAHATRATIHLSEHDGYTSITVADDGRGFDASDLDRAPTNGTTRFGLLNIRTRLSNLGGQLQIQSAGQSGTRVTLLLPQSAPKDLPPPDIHPSHPHNIR